MISKSLIKQRVSGIKVEVTATEISNSFPFMFSNYNGIGARDGECGQSLSQMQ